MSLRVAVGKALEFAVARESLVLLEATVCSPRRKLTLESRVEKRRKKPNESNEPLVRFVWLEIYV